MDIVMQTVKNMELPRPIYILGMIVHNSHVTDFFNQEGVISLDGENRVEILEQVDNGTVIFTAHGVSNEVRRRARMKGLTVIDATCPDVIRTHELIKEKTEQDYDVIYIGKKGHPEPEGAVGVAPGRVHLIEREDEVIPLPFTENSKLIITNQTTMGQWDIHQIVSRLLKRFPQAEVHNEICLATQLRQEAVAEQAKQVDLVLVVGDPRSNNSNRLAQVAEQIAGVKAYRIANITEIKQDWLKWPRKVAVTSGASTPTPITKEVIEYLERVKQDDPTTWENRRIVDMERLIPGARRKRTSQGHLLD